MSEKEEPVARLYLWQVDKIGVWVVVAALNVDEARPRAMERYDVGSDFSNFIRDNPPTSIRSTAITVFEGVF